MSFLLRICLTTSQSSRTQYLTCSSRLLRILLQIRPRVPPLRHLRTHRLVTRICLQLSHNHKRCLFHTMLINLFVSKFRCENLSIPHDLDSLWDKLTPVNYMDIMIRLSWVETRVLLDSYSVLQVLWVMVYKFFYDKSCASLPHSRLEGKLLYKSRFGYAGWRRITLHFCEMYLFS